VKLARDVFDAVFAECESFEAGRVGTDLAYLLGAIVDDPENTAFVDWSPGIHESKLPGILRARFPAESSLWKYIVVDTED
jgi:hypothetical protein